MNKEIVMVVVAMIGALVTIVGWAITNYMIRKREDRTRRLELILAHLKRQIEELYGPLLSLIEQIHSVWEVKQSVLKAVSGDSSEVAVRLIQQQHFFPLHNKIRDILSSKLYLVDSAEVPESFRNYLEHCTQQIIKRDLEDDGSYDTSNVVYAPWPKEFYDDVRNKMVLLMTRYDQCLSELDPRVVFRAKP